MSTVLQPNAEAVRSNLPQTEQEMLERALKRTAESICDRLNPDHEEGNPGLADRVINGSATLAALTDNAATIRDAKNYDQMAHAIANISELNFGEWANQLQFREYERLDQFQDTATIRGLAHSAQALRDDFARLTALRNGETPRFSGVGNPHNPFPR